MEISLDFRLLDVSLEIHALIDHFDLIDKQISHLSDIEKKALHDYRVRHQLTPDDPDWDIARQEYEQKVEFLLPRIFWGPFITSVYAVLETSITEISKLIQKSQKQGIGLNDLKGSFLERAKKYYKNVIKFELYNKASTWERIKVLAEVRNVIAHTNGRLDMIPNNSLQKLRRLEKQNIGISFSYKYLVFGSEFAKETLSIVREFLDNLVEKYKENYVEWDLSKYPV